MSETTQDRIQGMTAEEVVELLDLSPHPEGGFFRETHRLSGPEGERGHETAIYFLLRAGQTSVWHRVVDAVETWHFYAGAPIELRLAGSDHRIETHRLGTDLAGGERPQHVLAAGTWQSARSTGAWSLAGCTVAPAFEFSSFEMAPPGWTPGDGPYQKD